MKYKYNGKVLDGTSVKMLSYLSDGKVNDMGVVEVTHVLSGDVMYYPESSFNRLFEKVDNWF